MSPLWFNPKKFGTEVYLTKDTLEERYAIAYIRSISDIYFVIHSQYCIRNGCLFYPQSNGPRPLKSTGRHGPFNALVTCDMRYKGIVTWDMGIS